MSKPEPQVMPRSLNAAEVAVFETLLSLEPSRVDVCKLAEDWGVRVPDATLKRYCIR